MAPPTRGSLPPLFLSDLLAARHEFTDRELEREVPTEGDERAFVLFQIHFYGLLQEFFLRQLED